MLGFIGRDGFLEFLLADVAPWAYGIGDYFDVELGHLA